MDILDKETLKSMAKRYSNNDMGNAFVKIVVSDNDTETMSPEECVLKYIRILEGVRIRVKELHWSTKSSTVHQLMDSVSCMIMGYEDIIAEAFMGICGFKLKVGQVVPDIPEISDHVEIIEYLSTQTLNLLRMIMSDVRYIGISHKLEDMYCELNKFAYLATQE